MFDRPRNGGLNSESRKDVSAPGAAPIPFLFGVRSFFHPNFFYSWLFRAWCPFHFLIFSVKCFCHHSLRLPLLVDTFVPFATAQGHEYESGIWITRSLSVLCSSLTQIHSCGKCFLRSHSEFTLFRLPSDFCFTHRLRIKNRDEKSRNGRRNSETLFLNLFSFSYMSLFLSFEQQLIKFKICIRFTILRVYRKTIAISFLFENYKQVRTNL